MGPPIDRAHEGAHLPALDEDLSAGALPAEGTVSRRGVECILRRTARRRRAASGEHADMKDRKWHPARPFSSAIEPETHTAGSPPGKERLRERPRRPAPTRSAAQGNLAPAEQIVQCQNNGTCIGVSARSPQGGESPGAAVRRVSLNRDPRPSSLSTETEPPSCCAMCFTIASPRPVPPASRDRDFSTR